MKLCPFMNRIERRLMVSHLDGLSGERLLGKWWRNLLIVGEKVMTFMTVNDWWMVIDASVSHLLTGMEYWRIFGSPFWSYAVKVVITHLQCVQFIHSLFIPWSLGCYSWFAVVVFTGIVWSVWQSSIAVVRLRVYKIRWVVWVGFAHATDGHHTVLSRWVVWVIG